jgi:CBS domain containing-hemolysin-like protein
MIAARAEAADWWMLFGILILLVILVFFAVAEMGLSRMTKPKAQALADSGKRSGPALVRLVNHPEQWVNPLLLSVNVCQTVQATLTGIVFGRLFGAVGVVVGVTLNVVVFFIFAEAVPKTYAVLYSDKAALLAARPISGLVRFWPLRMISQAFIGLTNVIVRGKGLQDGPFIREREFLGMVEAAAEEEVIEHEERELIESVIEFGDTVAREIMVPRPDIVSVSSTSTIDHALDVSFESGMSRLPVFREDPEGNDDVVGIVYMKDLMRSIREGRGGESVLQILRDATVIPENKSVSKLMREMQGTHFHMAIIADEYGSVVGLITLEDCLEELVGEIVDEHDEQEVEVRQLMNGEMLVDGGMSIDDFNEYFALSVPDKEWDTVAGFVFGTLEHVPVRGEHIEIDGWRLTVEQLEGRRIRSVRMSPSTKSPISE